MSTTIVRSWGAIALGALLAIGTLVVLFWDVRAVSDITTDHVMTLAMLIVTIAAGHYWLPAVRQKRAVAAIGLAVLFFAGTFVCVTGSAGRGAEVASRKAAAAAQINADRKDAQDQLKAARETRDQLAERFAGECGTGKGARCKGMREALDAQDSHVRILQVRVDGLQPEQEANVRLKHAARVFAFFRPGADVKRIEEGLELTWPFALALIMELGTIVFLGLGLGDAGQSRRVPLVPPVPANDPGSRDEVSRWIREFRARNQRNPQIPEVQRQFSLPKTTAWRRIKAA